MAHLNLWKQQLGVVPEKVWDRLDLETLVLADNGLTEISDRISNLRRLRMLDLGHNELTHIPEALGELEDLTDFLYLHDNRLSVLPRSLARLIRLRYLNISGNAFTTLPAEIFELAHLVELRALDNQIASIPADLL